MIGRGAVVRILLVLVAGMPALLAGSNVAGQERVEGQEREPLTLSEAVGRALDRNREIDEARWGLRQAEDQVSEAWGEVYPRIDLSTTYTRNLTPAVSFLPAIFFDPGADPDDLMRVQFGAENQWSGQVQFQQPLFEARAFIGVGAAGRYESLQEEVLRGRTHEVITGVRTRFYDLLLAQEHARLLE